MMEGDVLISDQLPELNTIATLGGQCRQVG